jgi:DNA polymerase III alpha subunit
MVKEQISFDKLNTFIEQNPNILDISNNFTRELPNDIIYHHRLYREFKLIIKNKFVDCFKQVIEILKMTKNIPHIIRGSSGSSLTCFLLGITHIDPIKYNISLARFMNNLRTNLPDIDIDFPYNRRAEIFENIFSKWNNKVARISNHNMYHQKSAVRQAIREEGYNTFLPKYFSINKIFKQDNVINRIKNRKEDLIGTFRCYSLHCGGIVIFDEEISDDLLIKDKQLKFNKDDVEDNGYIKIDILSNRGLAQLWDVSQLPINEYPKNDTKIANLLSRGDNIGLTFAESPGMRKIFKDIKPKNIDDIAKALALIRPAASHSKGVDRQNTLIYDDDAIIYIQKVLKCKEAEAEIYRKAFAKNKKDKIKEFEKRISKHKDSAKIIDNLNCLRFYSFCKSHAYSYAQLVWALAYHKAYNPKEFWCSTINNCHSMYKKWVHYCEAKRHGLKLVIGNPPWKIKNNRLLNGAYQKKLMANPLHEYKTYGYWSDTNFLKGMYYSKEDKKIKFRGLIATYRKYKSKLTFITIGYDNGKYLDLSIGKIVGVTKYDVVEGSGFFKNHMIEVEDYKLITL